MTDPRQAKIRASTEADSGVCIHGLTFRYRTTTAAVSELMSRIATRERSAVFTPNLAHFAEFRRRPELQARYALADVFLQDGWPVAMACTRRSNGQMFHRIPGSDLVEQLLSWNTGSDYKLVVVGDSANSAYALATRLSREPTNWRTVHVEPAPRAELQDSAARAALITRVQAARPHLLLVALGFPKQEEFILEYMSHARSTGVAIGCGAAVAFSAGTQTRAHPHIRRIGLEWAHRLLSEPRRLWRRYLDAASALPWLLTG